MKNHNRLIVGKNAPPRGKTPSIILVNPKHARNVGMILRSASCFGFEQVWYTGTRIDDEMIGKTGKQRLPREERMKGYQDVQLISYDFPFDQFKNATPIAVEVRENAELLPNFEHPENPVYVFGAEDGGLKPPYINFCHRFVVIPTRHCLNLATAVNIVLYDRMIKETHNKGMPLITPGEFEHRGYDPHLEI